MEVNWYFVAGIVVAYLLGMFTTTLLDRMFPGGPTS